MTKNKPIQTNLIVVGSGPGGYTAAFRAADLGLNVILIEKDSQLGGVCLNRGCIPSKAFLHSANIINESKKAKKIGLSFEKPKIDIEKLHNWKNSIISNLNLGIKELSKKRNIQIINGTASFLSAKKIEVIDNQNKKIIIEFKKCIIATGSSPTKLRNSNISDPRIINSTQALSLKKIPKKMLIIGGGYIGLELGCALTKLGTEVTVIEGLDNVLSIMDKEIRRPLERWLKIKKVTVHTKALARGADVKGKGASRKVHLRFEMEGEEHTIKVDKVLVTVGRRPNSKGWGIENMGVRMDSSGNFIRIDRKCRTSAPGVFAIGDVAGEPMLAHKASSQGEMVAEIIAGHNREFDKVAIPAIVFTEPEIVSVGLNPDEARELGEEIITGKFPLAANGRALTLEAEKTGGFIRVTARKSDHVILGIQAVGSHVAELSGEFVLALEMGALLEDIADTVHAHPTMTESFHESVLKTLGHAIHIS